MYLPLVSKLQPGKTLLSRRLCLPYPQRPRYVVHDPRLAHFVTAAAVEWLPVFSTAACCDLLVESLEFCRREKGLKLYAWVILDTHLHAILAAPDLAGVLRDLKGFIAKWLHAQVEAEGSEWRGNQLSYYRATHKAQMHQIW